MRRKVASPFGPQSKISHLGMVKDPWKCRQKYQMGFFDNLNSSRWWEKPVADYDFDTLSLGYPNWILLTSETVCFMIVLNLSCLTRLSHTLFEQVMKWAASRAPIFAPLKSLPEGKRTKSFWIRIEPKPIIWGRKRVSIEHPADRSTYARAQNLTSHIVVLRSGPFILDKPDVSY